MNAIETKVGQKYLSPKGTPVTVIAHRGDKVILKVSGSDNEVPVAKTYALKPYKAAEVSRDARAFERANGDPKKGGRKKEGSVATLIDPLLFAGGKTTQEIAALVTKQAGALAKGRDINANVRARMVTYSRKGWKIEKNEKKHVRVIKPKGA